MHDIKAWLEAVKLKLNEAKTKFIYFGSRQQLNKATHTTTNVTGESIKRSTKVRYLGGHLDSNLTFKDNILIKCKAATLNIIKICNIRKYLTRETCHKVILQHDHITPRLCKLNTSRPAIIKYKNNAKHAKQDCKTNSQKKCQGKHHRMLHNPTLVTDTTKDRLQSMHFHP